jgi:hypothetical protein
MALFEDKTRTDNRRRQAGENWFRFLDRVDDVYFGRVRSLAEEWFAHLPVDHAGTFRRQFMTSDAAAADAAFFELYVHEVLRRLGFALSYEAELATSTHRPDYRAERSDATMFVEVRTVGDPEERARSRKLRHAAIEPLREIVSDHFTISLGIVREGASAPPTSKLVPVVEKWLSELDRDEIEALTAANHWRVPRLELEAGDWTFRFSPIVKPAHRVGVHPASGSVSLFPGRSSWGENWERVAAALKHKARRYGDLGTPFVIACLAGDVFVDDEDLVSALFGGPAFAVADDGRTVLGRQGGLWSGGANARVSAVLFVRQLVPTTVPVVIPTLWRNPDATHPLEIDIPPCGEGQLLDTGEIEIHDAAVAPHDFFELQPGWPGPERALRVRESV